MEAEAGDRRDVVRIGTRGSRLAVWQAEHVAARLRKLPNPPSVRIVRIETEGDRLATVPLHAIRGKAFFTKEIERALLEGSIDVAVHSLKDLATSLPPGVEVAAVLRREDPRDAWIHREGSRLEDAPSGTRVGTSSLRRRALLYAARPDIEVIDLRGNVPTRLEKLRRGDFDAIVLAVAGLKRLGLEERITERLPVERFLPAVSQGAVGVQCRSDDPRIRNLLTALDHAPSRDATSAERALLARLEGGCQVPVGSFARVEGERLAIAGVVASVDGRSEVRGRAEGHRESPAEVGHRLAGDLLGRGAREILDGIREERVRP